MKAAIELQYAAPYSPSRCRKHRDENMKIARLLRTSKSDAYYRVNTEMMVDAVKSARLWNHTAVNGGNEAYKWRIANHLPLEEGTI